MVGVSVRQTCGVRDHAALLADAMASEGISSSFHWLVRGESSIRGARREIREWTLRLQQQLTEEPPQAVLLHYSVFSYSHRGIPLFVRPTLSALRACGAPLIVMLHEFVYPWRRGDWRGNVWAVTQRAALIPVMRAAESVISTADDRVAWLRSRVWLPRRRVVLAPVFSNLPPPAAHAVPDPSSRVVGLFGYSYQGAALELILDAIGELMAAGVPVQLRLLGAPGRSSRAGEAWLRAASTRRLEKALSFSGALPAQSLSDELAACDVLLFADSAGPTSRKTSLAGSLASGRPVVALAGPQTWGKLVEAEALRVAEPTSTALAAALGALLADRRESEELGARGRAFAEREMTLARTVQAVASLLAHPEPVASLDGASPAAR